MKHFLCRQDDLPNLLLFLQGLSGNAPEYVKGGLNIRRQRLVEQSMDPVQQPLQLLPVIRRTVGIVRRSEEHTSELQSRENLVCRLLLEKKKKTKMKSC